MTEEERSQLTESKAKRIVRRIMANENSVLGLILIVLIAVFAGLTHGLNLTQRNVLGVLVQSSVRGIAAMGQTFVILTGGIDLSIGSIALLTMGLAATYMEGKVGHGPTAAGILIMLFVSMAIGSTTGLSVSRIKMPALIVTFALWIALKGMALRLTGGYIITNIPSQIGFLGQRYVAGFPVIGIAFIVIAAITYFVLEHTTFGRSVYATGGNPTGAWLSGINVDRIIVAVFAISGLMAGIASWATMSRIDCFTMAAVEGLEIDAIAITVVGGISLMGGRGSVIGVVIGTFIFGVISNGMNIMGVAPAFQTIAKGLIIYAAVAIDYLRRR
ncbi:MAG: ABC transporter permease [Dehalococcoidales bacterium]|jgi:ribose transport system permease protein|nr:ABC transporter permease [Dehalococcoidales bacterium]